MNRLSFGLTIHCPAELQRYSSLTSNKLCAITLSMQKLFRASGNRPLLCLSIGRLIVSVCLGHFFCDLSNISYCDCTRDTFPGKNSATKLMQNMTGYTQMDIIDCLLDKFYLQTDLYLEEKRWVWKNVGLMYNRYAPDKSNY